MTIEKLEETYIDAASELLSKQRALGNYIDELETFLKVRDQLKEHPDFSGNLPFTYFSGSDLDPEGRSEHNKHPTESRPC